MPDHCGNECQSEPETKLAFEGEVNGTKFYFCIAKWHVTLHLHLPSDLTFPRSKTVIVFHYFWGEFCSSSRLLSRMAGSESTSGCISSIVFNRTLNKTRSK
jgi:hypothetical protein